MKDQAIRLATELTLCVFPIRTRSKVSHIKGWPSEATTDVTTIERWWTEWPDANIGVATGPKSNLVVIDVDVQSGGIESFEKLRADFPDWPVTLEVRTGRGGYHYYLFHAAGAPLILSKNHALGPGIDVKADGGCVVGPGSVHENGARYECVRWMRPASVPAALLKLLPLKTKGTGTALQTTRTHEPGPVREGSRNDTLFRMACRLHRNGGSLEEVLADLRRANENFEPPLPDHEVQTIWSSAMRYTPAPDLTEQGISDAISKAVAGKVKYTTRYRWMSYREGVWTPDLDKLDIREMIKRWLDAAKAQVIANTRLTKDEQDSILKRIDSFRKNTPIKGIASLMESDLDIRDDGIWGEAENLVNFRNGTLELPSLTFREHRPEDRLMKKLPYDYDPDAECPNFDRVLREALDEEVAGFICRIFGHAVTGQGGLQKFVVLVGRGRNGKSVLLEGVAHAFGTYAVTAAPTTFVKSHNKSALNKDVAALCGARLVSMSETNQGQALDAALVKRVTGGDTLTARFLQKEFFQFEPKALVVMATNHVPGFDGSDSAMARRMIVLDFPNVVDAGRVDVDLPAKLKKETSGIMNRLLRGCLEFRRIGLAVPAAVQASTAREVEENNPVLQFVQECCEIEPKARRPVEAKTADHDESARLGAVEAAVAEARKAVEERPYKVGVQKLLVAIARGRSRRGIGPT